MAAGHRATKLDQIKQLADWLDLLQIQARLLTEILLIDECHYQHASRALQVMESL